MKKIIVGLGGSSTNDGGCGAAAAVGIKFYDRDGRQFIPTGGTTADIDRIDLSGRDSLLEQVEIVTMCDIDNPMYGPVGASFIFGPQKGADEAMVLQLDEGIRNLSRVIACLLYTSALFPIRITLSSKNVQFILTSQLFPK